MGGSSSKLPSVDKVLTQLKRVVPRKKRKGGGNIVKKLKPNRKRNPWKRPKKRSALPRKKKNKPASVLRFLLGEMKKESDKRRNAWQRKDEQTKRKKPPEPTGRKVSDGNGASEQNL